ncbi:hypothetical protein L218DRAFT_1063146 [Marasmius fiardii PR-910]|nr:hypothetical protein L218DRAFT_1063146 [Marasmius fiardii PR-910]
MHSQITLTLKLPFLILSREFLFLGFSWRDWSATIIPGSLFSIGAMRTHSDTSSIVPRYLLLTLWLTLYIYFCNLWDQITGIEEDRIDKSDRPIPSGKITIAGAQLRRALALAAFLSVAAYEPALRPETFCWVIIVVLHLATPSAFGNHWFVKNCVALGTGTWALLGASWKAIAPLTPRIEGYILAVSVWAGLMTHIQDLRDMKTLPLVLGNIRTRRIITYLIIPVSLMVLGVGGVLSIAPWSIITIHVFLGYRIIHNYGSRYDHKTYMLFVLNASQNYTYTFCLDWKAKPHAVVGQLKRFRIV